MRLLAIILLLMSGAVAADTVSVAVPDCVPAYHLRSDGRHIRSPGYSTTSSPGDPALPFKDMHIILPPDADLSSVSVRLSGETRTVAPSADIAPAPPIAVGSDGKPVLEWGKDKQIKAGRNVRVYGRQAFYPAANVKLTAVGRMRKWRIATVRYYPLRYNPVRRTLETTSYGQIVVSCQTKAAPSTASEKQLTDSVFAERVKSLAVNYQEAQAWYPQQTPGTVAEAATDSPPGYAIVTTAAIAATSAKLSAFVAHKTSRGFEVSVLTETAWGGGAGDAAATNLRSYLQSTYVAQNLKYVLLIGNPSPGTGDVPMKMLWPRLAEATYREAPSDYFYADLTGNWDLNSDGYYGDEEADFGPGGVDLFPEVIVGRIPHYGDVTALDSILQKTIDYESGVNCGGWMNNVILSMNPSDDTTPGYPLGEQIRTDALISADMTPVRIYDSDYGLVPAPEHTPCNLANVLSAWQQHAGFHFWWTHGGATYAADVFSTASCQYLDDDYPSFVFQSACLNAKPESTDNLAFSLLKRGAIAVDGATRVSWYRPGQDAFAGDDTNASMAYYYALKLIRDRMPCGDAHFAMQTAAPNTIWMNHCVFNIYGDPSVQYPAAPLIAHTPLGKTDNTTQPYVVAANVTTTSPLATGNPVLRWNTDGGSGFTSAPMLLVSGRTYSASIPAQPYGTTVYYYLAAEDITGLSSACPNGAPLSLLSFQVEPDTQMPLITHEPLEDTGNKFGPYPVQATVTDDTGVQSVSLYYNINGGAFVHLDMPPQGLDLYGVQIPGPTNPGDSISYYITAADSSRNANTTRLPVSPDCFSFHIGSSVYVAVFNSTANPYYFVGGNVNAWQAIRDVLEADPEHRFVVTVLTSLKPDLGPGLYGQDVLVLPDNGVPVDSTASVSDWFTAGRVIVAMESAACYASYSGWMWPGSAGVGGYNTYWNYGASANDQEIYASDQVTSGYTVGQIISSVAGSAQYFVGQLPADAHVLSVKNGDHTRAYAVYRDVPERGRLVALGPYIAPQPDQYPLIRNACVPPAEARQIGVTSPNGGESYSAGDTINITFTASGVWAPGDTIRLEYCTGLDSVWHALSGAESLDYAVGSFAWNTAGLPGSHGYLVRATWVGETLSDTSDGPFSVIPTVDTVTAKSAEDGALVKLAAKVVTCTVAGYTYVEEPNRRAGIKVTSAGISVADLVSITGTLSTVDGERVLEAETTEWLSAGAEIQPYAMLTSALGGSSLGLQPAVKEYKPVSGVPALHTARGPNNIGLLVRLCGSVTQPGDGYFYLDDGSGCDDGSGFAGVRVICPSTVTPDICDHVLIDAVSTTHFDGANTFRAVVLPGAESFRPL